MGAFLFQSLLVHYPSLLEELNIPSPLELLRHPVLERAGVRLWMKRDDLIHPVLSGNKWRKMQPLLEDALRLGATSLVGLGGGFSNLLHALAYAGYRLGIETIGWVRGTYVNTNNATLSDCSRWGMKVLPIPKEQFEQWRSRKTAGLMEDGKYFIPLGGTSDMGLKSVGRIMDEIYSQIHPQFVMVPIGSGGTMAGLISNARHGTTVMGFSTFKQDFEEAMIRDLVGNDGVARWEVVKRYPKPGFGKIDRGIRSFISSFEEEWGVPLDAVYNGKMMYSLLRMLEEGYFSRGTEIVTIHTGGLQGVRDLSIAPKF